MQRLKGEAAARDAELEAQMPPVAALSDESGSDASSDAPSDAPSDAVPDTPSGGAGL